MENEIIEAVRSISNKPGVVACGDNGCVEIWKDDQGRYRGAFYRFKCEKAGGLFPSPEGLIDWLKEWCPKVD